MVGAQVTHWVTGDVGDGNRALRAERGVVTADGTATAIPGTGFELGSERCGLAVRSLWLHPLHFLFHELVYLYSEVGAHPATDGAGVAVLLVDEAG